MKLWLFFPIRDDGLTVPKGRPLASRLVQAELAQGVVIDYDRLRKT